MPELPEVETVRRGLQPILEGARLTRVDVRRPTLRWPMPSDFAERTEGRRILSVERRAKYLLIRLEGGLTVIGHLGMSGRMRIIPDGHEAPLETHDHVVLRTEKGDEVRFNDPRRFGMMDLAPDEALGNHRLLALLGPEPLGNGFNGPVLAAALAGRRTPIKAALLDQRIVAGLGNIYVSEALFESGIAPRRLAMNIGAARAERLVIAIRKVLEAAIAAGGSTLRDHRQPDGQLGYFQHDFKVYGKAGEPCGACPGPPGCPGISIIRQAGRSTYYCPRRQR